jgi:subtilisin family serine protease
MAGHSQSRRDGIHWTPIRPRSARPRVRVAVAALGLLLFPAPAAATSVSVAETTTGAVARAAVNADQQTPLAGTTEGDYVVRFTRFARGKTRAILRRAGADLPQRDISPLRGPIFNGAAVDLNSKQLKRLRKSPLIREVERNHTITTATPPVTAATAATPYWNLSRINQRSLPLDGIFDPISTGAGVHVYVVDSGVNVNLPEFAGRVGQGFYLPTVADSTYDCQGHGTYVAGTALSTTYGVAKQAIVHPVRVLDCNGQGGSSGLIEALNWIAENVERPAIINTSLGGPKSDLMDAAVAKTISQGILTVASGGNNSADACAQSPASESTAITVGATEHNDRQADFSNFGSCLDIWAPGVGISSVGPLGQESVLSGTSIAAPAVTGVAAILWSLYPTADAADIANLVIKYATTDALSLTKPGSPNRLAYIDRQVPVVPFETLGKVRKLKSGKTTSNSVAAKWKIPNSDGGAKITKYETRIKVGGKWQDWQTKKAKKLKTSKKNHYEWTWSKLNSGKKYLVEVRARNTFGHGPKDKTALRTDKN